MSAKLSSDPACKTGERRSLAAMSIKAPRTADKMAAGVLRLAEPLMTKPLPTAGTLPALWQRLELTPLTSTYVEGDLGLIRYHMKDDRLAEVSYFLRPEPRDVIVDGFYVDEDEAGYADAWNDVLESWWVALVKACTDHWGAPAWANHYARAWVVKDKELEVALLDRSLLVLISDQPRRTAILDQVTALYDGGEYTGPRVGSDVLVGMALQFCSARAHDSFPPVDHIDRVARYAGIKLSKPQHSHEGAILVPSLGRGAWLAEDDRVSAVGLLVDVDKRLIHKSQARMALRPQVLSAGTGLWGAPLSDDGTWIWWQVQDKVMGLAPTLKPMPLVISAVGPDPTLAQRIASIAHHEKSD